MIAKTSISGKPEDAACNEFRFHEWIFFSTSITWAIFAGKASSCTGADGDFLPCLLYNSLYLLRLLFQHQRQRFVDDEEARTHGDRPELGYRWTDL